MVYRTLRTTSANWKPNKESVIHWRDNQAGDILGLTFPITSWVRR